MKLLIATFFLMFHLAHSLLFSSSSARSKYLHKLICPPSTNTRSGSTAIWAADFGPDDDELESLFNQIKDMDPDDVPQDMQDAIRNKISENAPADWKIRLRLMGFNPITIAGYMLAAVLITCNSVFGAGWAGDMLGMNEVVVSDRTQIPQPRMGSNERFSNSYDGIIRTEIQTIELNSKENLL